RAGARRGGARPARAGGGGAGGERASRAAGAAREDPGGAGRGSGGVGGGGPAPRGGGRRGAGHRPAGGVPGGAGRAARPLPAREVLVRPRRAGADPPGGAGGLRAGRRAHGRGARAAVPPLVGGLLPPAFPAGGMRLAAPPPLRHSWAPFVTSREALAVAYIITEPCIGTKDASCVEVCPVDCIYEGEDMYYIH